MVISLKFKNLLTVAILTGVVNFNSLATENAPYNPEVQSLPTKGEFYVIESLIPELKKGFIDSTPEDKKDAIPTGKLGADDGINLPHFQRSATKSYTAMDIGRAMQLGYLTMPDLNQPAVSFLKDLNSENFVDGAENITLEQIMSMRSGLGISGNNIKKIINTPGSNQRSRDMLKWDALIMNNGKLNGKQFIPAAFIAKATSRVAEPNVNSVPDVASICLISKLLQLNLIRKWPLAEHCSLGT